MPKSSVLTAFSSIAILAGLTVGCNPDAEVKPTPPPIIPTPTQAAAPSTQSSPAVAQIGNVTIARSELDGLLYETYGLRMMFDLVELNIAKATLLADHGRTLAPEDVQRERQMVIAKICGDAAPSDYDNLFNQFLQQERITRAEFEIKIVETNAYLRKIVEPLVIGKLPEAQIHRAFEQLYGAKRRIADITLGNVRDATIAHNKLRTMDFAEVAKMSIDPDERANGGEWPPFSMQSTEIPDAILQAAFSTEPGQVSDILATGSTFHIIKVIEAIAPPKKLVKYEDVKDNVRKQLEDQLIESNIKRLREGMQAQAQQQVRIEDPILRAQWEEMLAKARQKNVDPKSIGKQLDDQRAHSATQPTTLPAQ